MNVCLYLYKCVVNVGNVCFQGYGGMISSLIHSLVPSVFKSSVAVSVRESPNFSQRLKHLKGSFGGRQVINSLMKVSLKFTSFIFDSE